MNKEVIALRPSDIPGHVLQHVKIFNHVNCATALHRMAKVNNQLPGGLVKEAADALGARIVEVIGDFVPQGMSNIMWSFATLSIEPQPEVWDALLKRCAEMCATFEPQNVSNIVWALATMGRKETELVNVMMPIAEQKMRKFKAQELANMLWGMMKLSIQPTPGLVAACNVHMEATMRDFQSQNLANVMMAYAKLELDLPKSIWYSIGMKVCESVNEWKSQHIGNTIWAFASMASRSQQVAEEMTEDSKMMQGIIANIPRVARTCIPQETANIFWALAKMKLWNNGVQNAVAALSQRVMEQCRDMNGQDVVNVMWSYATWGRMPSEELCEAMFAVCVRCMSRFNAQVREIRLSCCFTWGVHIFAESACRRVDTS
jgi:hypothetical protein